VTLPQDTTRFQQGVDYRIEATLDESTHLLRGRARLRYTNRSQSTLDTLYFHQHLNAFRPNSAWARRELEFGNRRFQDLGPAEHAFERLARVEVGGRRVRPVYPGAPDSTVVAIPLPSRLRPGATATVQMEWTARLATLPRRQGREGRHYDWAHWYPRIAVYERTGWATQPLLPQGEFYGEFARYDVTLDLATDQVIGSTGVPVIGDPGWHRTASAQPAPSYQRTAYGARPAELLGLLPSRTAPGRKRVRWRAENVIHFAWSADPRFTYEGGAHTRTGSTAPVAIHALRIPGDTLWPEDVAVERTRRALVWMEDLFGPYPYPQITNLRRIESGGTEFPMLIMNGSASEGLIVHEIAHQWLHGILANNEWREGWLDEGFTSFVTNWYWEAQGKTDIWASSIRAAAQREREANRQPVATPSAEFRDPAIYSYNTYTKPSLVFRMLRELVGEPTFRQILRSYYQRYRFQHVTGADFQAVAEQVSGRDLGWFFQQWIATTATLDYAVEDARAERMPDGRWRTRVTVGRSGDAWMPVELRVGDTTQLLNSREARQQVEVVTPTRPAEAVLDPRSVLIDVNPANNRRAVS
jgi:hypothetical protein